MFMIPFPLTRRPVTSAAPPAVLRNTLPVLLTAIRLQPAGGVMTGTDDEDTPVNVPLI